MSKNRIILDVDTGIDDALAILYALFCPQVQLEGITVGYGNTRVTQALENTLRLLDYAAAGRSVPVFRGAAKPLVRAGVEHANFVHGNNGIGNVQLPQTERQPEAESAAAFIARLARENPGEITLVTTGRLTNLAQAIELDPGLPGKLKQVVVMGGTVHAPGNITPVAEANLWGDPEAAELVFASGAAVTLVGLDVTLKTRLTRQHLETLARIAPQENGHVVKFMQDVMEQYYHFYHKVNHWVDAAPLHDPLAMMVAVNPGLVTRRRMKVRVECESSLCTGMVVADLRPIPQSGYEIDVCLEVEADRAIGQFLSVFS